MQDHKALHSYVELGDSHYNYSKYFFKKMYAVSIGDQTCFGKNPS